MFFNVDSDRGAVISGWFAADNPAVSARLAIRAPGRDEVIVKADIQRDDVRDLGNAVGSLRDWLNDEGVDHRITWIITGTIGALGIMSVLGG